MAKMESAFWPNSYLIVLLNANILLYSWSVYKPITFFRLIPVLLTIELILYSLNYFFVKLNWILCFFIL